MRTGSYSLKTAMMKAKKVPAREGVAADAVAANPEQQSDRHRADRIHERRTDGLRAHRTKVGIEEPARRLFEPHHLPKLHIESFDDAVAGDGLVQNVLDLGQFVLAPARGLPHLAADPAG